MDASAKNVAQDNLPGMPPKKEYYNYDIATRSQALGYKVAGYLMRRSKRLQASVLALSMLFNARLLLEFSIQRQINHAFWIFMFATLHV